MSFQLYCQNCNFRRVSDTVNFPGLYRYPSSQIGRGHSTLPKGKVVAKDSVELMPKYRCPDCGHAIAAKRYKVKLADETNKDEGYSGGAPR